MAEKFYAEGEHHRTRRITYNVTEGEFQRMVAVARAFDLSNSKFSRLGMTRLLTVMEKMLATMNGPDGEDE